MSRFTNRTTRVAALFVASSISATSALSQTAYDWDNHSGDSQWTTRSDWNLFPNPPTTPGAFDTAILDGQLAGSGVGNNAVAVPHDTSVMELRVVDAAVVDMTIGDGSTASEFYVTRTLGDSLVLGDSPGVTATLNLRGGWLDTYRTFAGGRTSLNVAGAGPYWDSADVLISGDATASTAGVGLALGGQIVTHGNLDVGSDSGNGRVVVDGTPAQTFGPVPLWTVTGTWREPRYVRRS